MPRGWDPAEREEFRQKLIEDLSLTRFARMEPSPELAKGLGVDESVLVLAQKLARAGFAPADEPRIKFCLMNVMCPRALAGPVMVLAKRTLFQHPRGNGTAVGQMARALMHSAMQTEREPERRAHGQWGPLPGCEDARYRLAAGQEKRAIDYHTKAEITEGLNRAIELRARAEGVSRSRYVILWLADLVDGLLPDLPVVPVSRWQLYADEKSYVLPTRISVAEEKNAGPLPTAATPPALSPCPTPEGPAR
jgi:hypothetical protein